MGPKFSDFRRTRKRLRRTLSFGRNDATSLNLPLSDFVVSYFDKTSPFDYLSPCVSSFISQRGYADPCTLVVAMIYLDRLRTKDKNYFESSDPADLYLPALVLASKFLYDTDSPDCAKNSDWADALEMDDDEFNDLEWEFVKKLDWNVMVHDEEYGRWESGIERWVADDFVRKYGFCTYNEMVQLSSGVAEAQYQNILRSILSFFGLATFVYAVSVFSAFTVSAKLTAMSHALNESAMNAKSAAAAEEQIHPYFDESYSKWDQPSTSDFYPVDLAIKGNLVEDEDKFPSRCNRIPSVLSPAFGARCSIESIHSPNFNPDTHIMSQFKNLSMFSFLGRVS